MPIYIVFKRCKWLNHTNMHKICLYIMLISLFLSSPSPPPKAIILVSLYLVRTPFFGLSQNFSSPFPFVCARACDKYAYIMLISLFLSPPPPQKKKKQANKRLLVSLYLVRSPFFGLSAQNVSAPNDTQALPPPPEKILDTQLLMSLQERSDVEWKWLETRQNDCWTYNGYVVI